METRSVILGFCAALLLGFSASVQSMGGDAGSWYEQWYQDWSQEEQRVEQRGQQVQRVEKTRCEKKIDKYRQRHGEALVDDPDEERYLTRYYGWKLDNWIERCAVE